MPEQSAKPGLLSEIIRVANPVFIVIAVLLPLSLLLYAVHMGPLVLLFYLHILCGALWTGIDLFIGFVLGPILGKSTVETRVQVFSRLIPKITFLMPTMAIVVTTSGFYLVQELHYSFGDPWIIAALIVAGLLTIQGLGLLIPNEVRIFQQLLSDTPDGQKIARLGLFNAKLGAIQGLLQITIILIMANIRM